MPGASQPTVHLIYPTGPRISTPWAIGRKITEHLSSRFTVVHHDIEAAYAIDPAPGDILLGHSLSPPWSVFRRSVVRPGWGRKILLQPFSPGDSRQGFWLPEVVPHCDLFLAITGGYWIDAMPTTHLAHLGPKVVHLDLAIDRGDFPRVKSSFNPIGKRRFVFIGNGAWYKNLSFLDSIAKCLPHVEFAWIGPGKKQIRHLRQLGPRDFNLATVRDEVAGYDFMITVGLADANPTTILEAMAWGLIPICTPQSGYRGFPGIPNVPLNDVAGAIAVIERLQQLPETELAAMQADNDLQLDQHFTWARFCAQIDSAIHSSSSPMIHGESFGNRMARLWWAQRSPFRWWRWRTLRRRAKSLIFDSTKWNKP